MTLQAAMDKRSYETAIHVAAVSEVHPWFMPANVDDIHTIPVSHGEGRFVAPEEVIEELFENGQCSHNMLILS